jgi:hypothetical protein
MRKFLAVVGLLGLALLVAVIAGELLSDGIGGAAYRRADCPECGRPAVFHGPDRDVRPANWAWFDCDHCRLRFVRYDDGRVSVPQ